MWKFHLFGIPIGVQPFFWLIAALIGLFASGTPGGGYNVALAVLIIPITLVSFLVHELGHALVAKHYGARPGIVLHGMGGTTSYVGGRFNRNRQIAITIAGPLAGFALALIFYGLLIILARVNPASLLTTALFIGIFLNLLWNILNLMPVMPMDGGQILRDALGPRHRKAVSLTGAVTGAILCGVALVMGQPFIAILFGFLAWQNYKDIPLQGGVVRR